MHSYIQSSRMCSCGQNMLFQFAGTAKDNFAEYVGVFNCELCSKSFVGNLMPNEQEKQSMVAALMEATLAETIDIAVTH